MPHSMKFYHDQLIAAGKAPALPAAHRLLYVRHGSIVANGQPLDQDATGYFGDELVLEGTTDWSQVWRWELAPPNAAPVLLSGDGTLSSLRLARAITTLELAAGTSWLFRLDSITSAPGRITPRHQHHGPGIRVLYQGTFNVQDAGHATENIQPGQPWWESGVDTVMAWHSTQMPAIFIRAMVLPTDIRGEMSNIWLSNAPATRTNWRLFIDQEITV